MRANATFSGERLAGGPALREQTATGSNQGRQIVEELRARGVVTLTKVQMAAALQVSYRTITAMISRREIPFFRIGGKHVRIRVEHALEVLADGHHVDRKAEG